MASPPLVVDENMDWKKGDRNAPFGHQLSPILSYIGFEMEIVTPTCVQGRFVVSERSAQAYGVLHGGISAFIAESLGSLGASVAAGLQKVAGVELSISHLQPGYIGLEIEAKATPIHIGRRLHARGVLHGGISAFIAESLGSLGAFVASGFQPVAGVDLSTSHLRPAPVGLEIEAKATPVHIGHRLHVWEVKFTSATSSSKGLPKQESFRTLEPELIAVSKLTATVLPSKPGAKFQDDKAIRSRF